MRFSATILVAFTVFGCAGDSSPVSPPARAPIEPGKTFLIGMVVDGSGVCIPGATVLVLKGQRAGETLAQKTPCNAWGVDGGFTFKDVTVGVEMTLQVSAPGYGFDERKVVPSAGSQSYILFAPSSNN